MNDAGCAFDRGGMACSRRAMFTVDTEHEIVNCCREHLADFIEGNRPSIVIRIDEDDDGEGSA